MSRQRVSDTGAIPDKFKKRMTNICIELDGAAMLRDKLTLYKSNADVVLCPHSIAIKYIIAARYITEPRHTLYKRPTATALSLAYGNNCVCTYCDQPYVFGTQWCLGRCWVPITTHAVQDHIAFIPVQSARADELQRVYGLTTKSLQQLVDKDWASSIHPLTITMSGVISEYRYTGEPKRQRKASPPRIPPTAEAGAGRPTHQQAAARPPRAQRYPTYGDPAIRGDCSHLENEDVRKYNKGAKKRRDGNSQLYSNHTDRYQRDAGYRSNCQNHIPPTPEHLYYENGDYAW